jgi:antitoxin MazE
MQTQIAKWGNSLAVRLPREVVQAASLSEGSSIDVMVEGGVVVLRPTRPRYRVEDLVVGMTPEAMRDAYDWGPDVGREIIR